MLRGIRLQRAQEIASFIRSSFRSIWSLELLLHLKKQSWESFTKDQLVNDLRASSAVVEDSVSTLLAAGLILEEEGGKYRYAPISEEVSRMVAETETLYRLKPNAVRRVIVVGTDNLAAFAEAFRLRKH